MPASKVTTQLNAGALDRRIVIQSSTASQSETGDPTLTWGTFATVWAEALPVASEERFSATAFHGVRGYKFRIRYLSGVENTMRVSFESRFYKIIGIAEIGRKAGLELLAELVE